MKYRMFETKQFDTVSREIVASNELQYLGILTNDLSIYRITNGGECAVLFAGYDASKVLEWLSYHPNYKGEHGPLAWRN
jgi:hypothetical protein